MDNRDKEIEYLEERVKELEYFLRKISKKKRPSIRFRHRRSKLSFGEDPHAHEINPVCSLCATIKNVELKKDFDVYLCSKCENNWN